MEILVLIVFILTLAFGSVLLVGAPYLPTLTPQVNAALDLVDLKPGEHLLELGCGDGKVLISAAERGLRVTGYELNPIMCFVAWARTRRYRKQVRVIWGNFWSVALPPAEGIFVFLLPKYMERLDKKIVQEYTGEKIKLVSFAFKIPSRKPIKTHEAIFLYHYE